MNKKKSHHTIAPITPYTKRNMARDQIIFIPQYPHTRQASKKEIPIINYNKVVRTIPKPKIMTTGPCIVYVSNKKYPLVKFIYHLRHKTWQRQKRIIEYMPFPKTYKRYYRMYDELYRVEYYNQYLTP